MNGSQPWLDYHNPLGLRSFRRRLDILRRQYLNHQFERRSPLTALSDDLLAAIYDSEVIFPPRRLLMLPGTQTIDGLFFLTSIAKSLRPRSIFEIGTYVGLTAWTLARNLPDSTVHTLDIHEHESPALRLEADDLHRASAATMVYESLPGAPGIEQHWGDSARFDFSPWYGEVDLVYVDGAHSEDYVRSDTDRAVRMVSPEGAIVWDDYWRLSPGVVTVLHERTDIDLWRVPGTRLVVYLTAGARRRLGGER